MRFLYLLFPVALFCAFTASAHHNVCSEGQIQRGVSHRGTLASPLELAYDVNYVKIDLAMSNLNTDIKGNTTVKATVADPAGMSGYAFELNDNMTIDSAKFNGALVGSVVSAGNHVRIITPAVTLPQNQAFTAQIFYHGTAANGGTGFFNGGIVNSTSPAGAKITYTMSDDYFAKDWWPSKQVLGDKIDSADIWITVPAGTKAGCNGLLKNVTPTGTGNRYEWKTNYPIDYYLISAAVAPYIDHRQTLHFSNSTDTMLVQHFVYDSASFMPAYGPALDSTPYMIDHFSDLFGRYPFWKEKYGHCTAPLSGGMEHQTMTTLGAYTTPLIAHELGHQWWGDHVTYASWRDIWMSEGWASYCEQLYVEHFRGTAAAQIYRTSVFNRVMGMPDGTVYLNDTSDVSRTFDSRLTYDKGAAVAHMLRFVAPFDAVYFSGLQAYQQQYAFKNATTEDFKAVMEIAYGFDLDTFFNQWVYGEGYPTYTAKWNQSGNTVFVQLNQTTSKPASVPLFITPLEIRLNAANADTVIRIQNNAAQQNFSFTWNKTMTGLTVDPNNHILNRVGAITKDPVLAVSKVQAANSLRIYPNPARDSWQVAGLHGERLILFNTAGQKVWEQNAAGETVTIPAAALPSGNYELEIIRNSQVAEVKKLTRW